MKYWPIFISILTVGVFLLFKNLGQVSLTDIFVYGGINLIFYHLIIMHFAARNGKLIDKEGFGKYIWRPSKLQPIDFDRLTNKERKSLFAKYPSIEINNKIIGQCSWLRFLHPVIAVLTLWS